MTKHGNAFTIRGMIRDPQDKGGVAGLTVEVLDEHLVVDRRLGPAETDEHGRFELRYAGRDFASVFLQARPRLYLQVKNAAGEVVHMTTTPVVHEAVAVRGIELELSRAAVPTAAVEPTRAFFKQIVGINPNYFGGAPSSGLPQLSQLGQSTQYESLGCIGLSPQDDTLEAIVTVKLPYGYGGGLCQPGPKEYVAFFIDSGDGLGFVAAGPPAEVRVHDLMATGAGELSFAVRRAFTPSRLLECQVPQVVRLRAILSWEVIPTNPNYPPIWGDVKEAWIQLRPAMLIPWIPLPIPGGYAMFGDLATIKATAEASLQALAVQAASGKVEPERTQLVPLLTKNPNYFGSLSKAKLGPKLLDDLAGFPVVAGLDPGLLEPVLPQFQLATSYEELTCVGLYPEEDLLDATLLVKQSLGYGGDLCTTGSVEYVAFYVDWGSGYEHVGTDKVPVHDIPADGRHLHYAAKVRIADVERRLRECAHENIVSVRAVLSWNYDPTPFGPVYVPPWGNVLDRRVQLRPLTGPNATCEIELVSEIHVGEISQSGPERGYAIDPGDTVPPPSFNRPFGGIVACHGIVNVPGATRYRFMVSADGGLTWDPVRDPRYARNPVPWLPPIVRTPDIEGWFSIAEYLSVDLPTYGLTALLHWNTSGKNGAYKLRLELGDAFGPMPGQLDEVDVHLDNRGIEFFEFFGSLPALPMIGVAVKDAGGAPKKCGEFMGKEKIRVFGNFRDDHFASWSVRVAGGNLPPSGMQVAADALPSTIPGIGPTGITSAGHGTPGLQLAEFDLCSPAYPQSPMKVRCAYVVSLTVWDRTIVGYTSGHVFGTTRRGDTVHVTFNWDPAGQC